MADDLITSSVTLHSRFPHATSLLHEALARALAQTGRKIAERTREGMTPGHFLDSGVSQDETRYEQLTTTSGQVHIPTDYAGDAEYGTHAMEARPVLRPAVAATWPATLHGYWGQAMAGLKAGEQQVLPEIDQPGPAMQPISREDRPAQARTVR